MRKEYNFRVLSDQLCIDCGRQLKANLVANNPKANRCWIDHKISQGVYPLKYLKLKDKRDHKV